MEALLGESLEYRISMCSQSEAGMVLASRDNTLDIKGMVRMGNRPEAADNSTMALRRDCLDVTANFW